MFNPPHPGTILKEDIISALGLNMEATAKHLGISRKHLSNICNGKNPIQAALSVKLENAFGAPKAETWMKMQAAYDISIAKQDNSTNVKRIKAA